MTDNLIKVLKIFSDFEDGELEEISACFKPKSIKKNDILLLCSDGLSNTITDSELLAAVVGGKKLEDIGQGLLELALSRGAPDNVTLGLLQK